MQDLVALYAGSPGLFTGSIFVLGLIVGSFLNVVIYRLPRMLEQQWRAQAYEYTHQSDATTEVLAASEPRPTAAAGAEGAGSQRGPGQPPAHFGLVTPRSACPKCGTPIKARHNIPILSWLILKGRCAACRAPISIRYPLVELATGLLSAAVAWHFGFGAPTACALLVTWSLIALTGIDLDHQLLPDGITLPLLWAGLLAAVAIGPIAGSPIPVDPKNAILGAAAGYLSLWSVYHAFRLLTGKEGMGYGDFKLFAALGAWLGWKLLPLIILLSAATGAFLGIALIVLKGRDRAAPMPFGPYLAAAGWLALMYGDTLIGGYLRLSGLRH